MRGLLSGTRPNDTHPCRLSMYGKAYWGAQRSTFVLDEEGVVRKVIKKAKPETHDADVLAALADLGAAA